MAANYGLFNRTLYNKLLKATEKAHKGALLRRGNNPRTEAYYEHHPKVRAYGELITLLLHVKSTLDHGGHGSGHGSTDVEEILSKYTIGAPLDYQRIIHASVMNRTVRNAAEQFFSELFGKKYVEKDVDPSHRAHARPSSRPLQPTPAPRGRTGPALARARAGAGAGAGDIKGFEEYVSTEFDTIKRRLDSHDELFDGLYANYEEYKGYLKNKEKDLLRLDELSGFVDRWRILINRGHFPTRQEMDEITRKLKVLEGEVTAFQVAFDEIKEYVDSRLQEHSKNIDRKIAQERDITAQAFDEERKYTNEVSRLLAGQILTLQNTLGEYEGRTSQLEAQIFALKDLDPGATIKLLKILKGMGLDEYIRKIFSELESLKKQPPSQEIMDRLVVLENWIKGVGEQEFQTISDALNAAIEAAWVKQKAYIDEKDKGLQDQITQFKGTLNALASKADALTGKIDTKGDKKVLEELQAKVAALEEASRKSVTSDPDKETKRREEIANEIQTQLVVIEKSINIKFGEKIKAEAERVDAIIAELKRQIKGLQKGHDDLTRDLAGKLDTATFNRFKQDHGQEMLALDKQLKEYAARMGNLEQELERLKNRPVGPGVPDQGILDKIAKIEREFSEMRSMVERHDTHILALENTITRIVERLLKAKVEEERKITRDSIKIVQDNITQTQRNYDAAIEELRKQDAKLKEEIEKIKRDKADLGLVNALQASSAQYKIQIEALEKQYKALNEEIQRLRDRVSIPPGPAADPSAGFREELRKAKADIEAINARLATLTQQQKDTLSSITRNIMEQVRETIRGSIRDVRTNYDKIIEDLKTADERLTKELEALRRGKADQSKVAALEDLQGRNYQELKQQYAALFQQLAALEKRLQEPVPPVPPGPGGPGIPPAIDLEALKKAIEKANKEISDISQKLADLDREQKKQFAGITTTILETIREEIKKNNDVRKQEIGRDLLVFLDKDRKVLDELRIRLVGNNVDPGTIEALRKRIDALEKQIAEGIPEAPEFAQLQAEMGDINTLIINLNQRNMDARLAEFQQKQLIENTRQFEMALVDAHYVNRARLMQEDKERIKRQYDSLFSAEFDRRAKEIKERSDLELKGQEERIRAKYPPGVVQNRLLASYQKNINLKLQETLSKLATEIKNSQQPNIERDIAALEMEVANKIRQENEQKITAQMERLKNELNVDGKLNALKRELNGELAAIRANADSQKESLAAFQRQLNEQQRAIDRINAQSAEALAKANAVGADVDALKPQVRTAVADANAAKGDAKTAKESSAVAAVDAKAAKDISTALEARVAALQAALKKAEDDKKKHDDEIAALRAAVAAAQARADLGVTNAATAQTAAAAAHGLATNAGTVATRADKAAEEANRLAGAAGTAAAAAQGRADAAHKLASEAETAAAAARTTAARVEAAQAVLRADVDRFGLAVGTAQARADAAHGVATDALKEARAAAANRGLSEAEVDARITKKTTRGPT